MNADEIVMELRGIAIDIPSRVNILFGAADLIESLQAQLAEAQPENKPLTLDELREMDGEPVYIVVLDKTDFADKDDAINGWGLCRKSWARLWDNARADIVHIDHDFEDYGKTWLAYRHKPEEDLQC